MSVFKFSHVQIKDFWIFVFWLIIFVIGFACYFIRFQIKRNNRCYRMMQKSIFLFLYEMNHYRTITEPLGHLVLFKRSWLLILCWFLSISDFIILFPKMAKDWIKYLSVLIQHHNGAQFVIIWWQKVFTGRRAGRCGFYQEVTWITI